MCVCLYVSTCISVCISGLISILWLKKAHEDQNPVCTIKFNLILNLFKITVEHHVGKQVVQVPPIEFIPSMVWSHITSVM